MSMELFVLFAIQDAPNIEQWKQALAEHNVPVTIAEQVDLSAHSGFLPMKLGAEDTGLYFLIESYADLAGNVPALREVSLKDPVVYSLSFGGHFEEGAVVFYSASALTAEFNGVAFDPQGGSFMNSEELLEAAKQLHQLATQ